MVAHVVPEYLPRSATFVYTTVRSQGRYRALILTRRMANLSEFPLDAEIVALDPEEARSAATRVLHDVRYGRGIRRAVKQRRCSLIHAHFGWSGPRALFASQRADIPLVTTFYGRDLAQRKGRASLRHPYDRLFEKGDLFTCEGPAMAAELAGIGCPSERIRLVKIGVDLSRFPFAPRQRTRPLVFLQTARLVEKKGVDTTIRAFAAAQPELGGSELWIIGDGPLRGELGQLAGSLGIEPSVRFLGELTHSDYIRATERAHICVQPSRRARDGDTEGGAPTVLIEMQALGLGVVATRHADIPEVVAHPHDLPAENDVDGVADALVRLAQISDAEWHRWLIEAREFVEREHDAHVTAGQYEQLYDQAIARRD